MKHVAKERPPEDFEAWKALADDRWTPTYGDLRNPQKRIVHEALLKEQGWVCCYCGREIAAQDSHIEHFRPQEMAPELALEFDNLFASCIREREPGAPLHCGHGKGSEFSADSYISPLDAGCGMRASLSVHAGRRGQSGGARRRGGTLYDRAFEAGSRILEESPSEGPGAGL